MLAIVKKRLRSKTYWFNFIIGIFAAGPQILPVLAPYLTPDYYSTLTLVLTVGNFLMRELTTAALSEK